MNRGAPLALAATLLVAGCDSAESPSPPEVHGSSADVPMLFMGNSHASYNDIQGMVEAMVGAARAPQTVEVVGVPNWQFLEQHYYDPTTLAYLQLQDWSFVVLQAQKYSTTGCCTYSTEEAKALIRIARARHAVPILFPEWPRLGIDETFTIWQVHLSIAQVEPACIAPIPQAFDLALFRHPGLELHSSDGNHSNEAGAFLAALILSATMTGASPLDTPQLAGFGVSAGDQALLRAVAADTVAAWPPRDHCPDDPYPPAAPP